MNRSTAKSITMPILLRIAKKMPIKGFLAEIGTHRRLFPTMDEARNWIDGFPSYLKENPNEMPTISYGWYKNVIVCL